MSERLRNRYGGFDENRLELLRAVDEKIYQALELLLDAGIDEADVELYVIQIATTFGSNARLQQSMMAHHEDRKKR